MNLVMLFLFSYHSVFSRYAFRTQKSSKIGAHWRHHWWLFKGKIRFAKTLLLFIESHKGILVWPIAAMTQEARNTIIRSDYSSLHLILLHGFWSFLIWLDLTTSSFLLQKFRRSFDVSIFLLLKPFFALLVVFIRIYLSLVFFDISFWLESAFFNFIFLSSSPIQNNFGFLLGLPDLVSGHKIYTRVVFHAHITDLFCSEIWFDF
mmetsp:Transcript_24518/g.28573  ORF Transcript_24518/g.28573 Transcript_24518/m.28573 type:complete len:205 (+) Transcript_24518:544-1158(+)